MFFLLPPYKANGCILLRFTNVPEKISSFCHSPYIPSSYWINTHNYFILKAQESEIIIAIQRPWLNFLDAHQVLISIPLQDTLYVFHVTSILTELSVFLMFSNLHELIPIFSNFILVLLIVTMYRILSPSNVILIRKNKPYTRFTAGCYFQPTPTPLIWNFLSHKGHVECFSSPIHTWLELILNSAGVFHIFSHLGTQFQGVYPYLYNK